MLENIKAVISDMDGVLWRGDVPLPGLNTLFDYFQETETPFILATNNSRKTQDDYVHKLKKMSVSDVKPHNVITSGTATASYLQHTYPAGTKLFVVGGDGLKQSICCVFCTTAVVNGHEFKICRREGDFPSLIIFIGMLGITAL